MKKLLHIQKKIYLRDGTPAYENKETKEEATIGSCVIKALDNGVDKLENARKAIKIADAIEEAVKAGKKEVELEENSYLETIEKAVDSYPFFSLIKARIKEAIEESEEEYRTRNENKGKKK